MPRQKPTKGKVMDVTLAVGDKVLVTYAYDGSGVALRTAATLMYDNALDDQVVVRLDAATDEIRKALDVDRTKVYVTVPRDSLSAPDSAAKIASFGWLD